METRGKILTVFLMDGEPFERVKCTLGNWIGVAYKIPCTKWDQCLEECKNNVPDRAHFKQSGVYFLFGVTEKTEQEVVYVGQASVRQNGDGILARVKEHDNPEEKYEGETAEWREAVVFTTLHGSFGLTDIGYLEKRFTEMAHKIEADRYKVKNANTPNSGPVSEEKKNELEEFIYWAQIVMGILGYKVFDSRPPASSTSRAAKDADASDDEDAIEMFTIEKPDRGIDAQAIRYGGDWVLLTESVISKSMAPTCPKGARMMRENNKDYIKDGVLKKDLLFRSPSSAAQFVLGSPVNGYREWKDKDGKTLDELRASGGSAEKKQRRQRKGEPTQ